MVTLHIHLPTTITSLTANPGRLYNAGNWLAISAAIAQQVTLTSNDAEQTFTAVAAYFFGSWPAVFVTFATLTFFIGGDFYGRAWANGFPPVESANRAGHLWSALGAVSLGFGLVCFAQGPAALALATLSTTLHAGGKLGSAVFGESDVDFKLLPLLSRLPYCVSLCLDIHAQSVIATSTSEFISFSILPLALIGCTILWATADCKLMPTSPWKQVKSLFSF